MAKVNVYGELNCAEVDGKLARTDQIYDYAKGKYQSEINDSVSAATQSEIQESIQQLETTLEDLQEAEASAVSDAQAAIGESKEDALEEIAQAIENLEVHYDIETDKGTVKDVQLKDGQGNKLMPKTGEEQVFKIDYLFKLKDTKTVASQQAWYVTNPFTALTRNTNYHVIVKSSSPSPGTYSIYKMAGNTGHGEVSKYLKGATEHEFDFNTGDYDINKFQIAVSYVAMTWTFEIYDISNKNLTEKLTDIDNKLEELRVNQTYQLSLYCTSSGTGSGWYTLPPHPHYIYPGELCKIELEFDEPTTSNISVLTFSGSSFMENVGTVPAGSENATFYFNPTKSFNRYQVISTPTITIHTRTYVVSEFLKDYHKNIEYLNESVNYKSNIISLAHQGYSIDSYSSYGQCKEEAMVASYYNKFDGVEVDLIFSSDDVPFLSHDPSFVDLDTSNSITIANETAENLEGYNYYGGKIQSLESCLKTCKKLGLMVYLDHTGTITSQAKADNVINLIDKYRMWGNIIFTTASTYLSAQILKSHYDDVTIASVYSRAITADDINALNTMAESYHVFASFTYNLNPIDSLLPLIANLNKKVKLAVWTVDDVEVYNQYLPYVDCIISNQLSDFIAKTGMRYIKNIT